jgi:hypothetical protein
MYSEQMQQQQQQHRKQEVGEEQSFIGAAKIKK